MWWCLFNAKPLPEPMLSSCSLDFGEFWWNLIKIQFSCKEIKLEMSAKCSPQYVGAMKLGNCTSLLSVLCVPMILSLSVWDHHQMCYRWIPLQWRHNGCYGISNHQSHKCLLNYLFRCKSKKTSKLRITGLCAGNSPVTSEFPTQRFSNVENVSIDDIIMLSDCFALKRK